MTKDPRPQDPYIVPWVPLRSHAWCFEELFMDFDSSTIYLGPKSWYSSLKHFQGLETHTNFSNFMPQWFHQVQMHGFIPWKITKALIQIHITQNHLTTLTSSINHRTMIPVGSHVWLIEETFLALNGQKNPLGSKVKVSSPYHIQGSKT